MRHAFRPGALAIALVLVPARVPADGTSLIGSVVDGYDPQCFCGSPSGAFLSS
jgi:hypothetical protein